MDSLSRLHSVMDSNMSAKQEKCYNPQDPTLRFVDRYDDLDFLCEGFKSPRALMSCGHAVTPTSLTNWCLRLLEQGKFRFTCGVCAAEWPFNEVRKMALLTPREVENFQKTLDFNAARQMLNIKLPLKTLETCPETTFRSVVCPSIRACPTCGLLLEHTKKLCKRVDCPRCKVQFCFLCLKSSCGLCCSVAPRQTSIPVW